MKKILIILSLWVIALTSCEQKKQSTQTKKQEPAAYIKENYEKSVYDIEMRDGVKLKTIVYSPKDDSKKYPVLYLRTPYNIKPYEAAKMPSKLGPSDKFVYEKYIFVYQDVRGRFMSEGKFENMRPISTNKNDTTTIDESTDAWDTIDWLVKNLDNDNGKVGMWGISYPGFYAACALVNSHPALKAVSPQAPIADWYFDDFHHHGAFFLPHFFNFFAVFGIPQKGFTQNWPERFKHGTPDGYSFFMDLGPLSNINQKYFHHEIPYWNEFIEHPDYDEYWQARNILPHLKNIKPAVMTVVGLFDAEDLYGPLHIYQTIEENNPGIDNHLVLGPWRHGGWARDSGSVHGNIFFGDNPPPSVFFQQEVELPFFNFYLKDKGKLNLPEALVFETGKNKWRKFTTWPPQNPDSIKFYLHADEKLDFSPPQTNGFDEFISDPDKPVPYTRYINIGMRPEYMTEDQRFAARRPDVLVYQTNELKEPITIAGKLTANLKVSTSQTSADWIVKLIDVYPCEHEDYDFNPKHIKMGGYQQMVRSEVFRGRYRHSYAEPKPFVPGEITEVVFDLQDVLHTFKKGHRIMIQIQSTWFPMVDRNPQKYVENIYKEATDDDFVKAIHRIYRKQNHYSFIAAQKYEFSD